MLDSKGTIPMLCRYSTATGKDVLTIRPGFFLAGNAGGILAGQLIQYPAVKERF